MIEERISLHPPALEVAAEAGMKHDRGQTALSIVDVKDDRTYSSLQTSAIHLW